MSREWKCVWMLLLLHVGRIAAADPDTVDVNVDEEVDLTHHRPYDFLYKEGVTAYLDNDWETCLKYLEEALQDWHWWHNNLVRLVSIRGCL